MIKNKFTHMEESTLPQSFFDLSQESQESIVIRAAKKANEEQREFMDSNKECAFCRKELTFLVSGVCNMCGGKFARNSKKCICACHDQPEKLEHSSECCDKMNGYLEKYLLTKDNQYLRDYSKAVEKGEKILLRS